NKYIFTVNSEEPHYLRIHYSIAHYSIAHYFAHSHFLLTFGISMSSMSLKRRKRYQLTDKLVYIVGPLKLQNDLMALFLKREAGAKCLVGKDFRHIPVTDDENIGQPKLVLLDCLGKDMESLLVELESTGKKILYQNLVALFNVSPSWRIEEKAVGLGLRGFFYEGDTLDRITKGVYVIFNGEFWLSRDIMAKCLLKYKEQSNPFMRDEINLTPREIEVLTMVALGAKNEKIAHKLCISSHTVKTHIYNIFKKINVSNRLQATLWAAKNL
ncbi:response regulator transcription factor, partial [bacterium]|nr:response regulator transcription factor [bacterium]